ncbi:MAG TPA: SufD family Fe-S cluster assembly protein [Termitinemataceae bacterium]|nr:SufD family Fe-S cluster assembly protein [Termitinemataceae bacterium]HOM24285.1 SufD family Fe-S cluster assembly protein [Termitinemataceae bacterium]HPQ01406.1 SufD family Fe-S cluster assembly protein [Termitinemataceae bacterium]
MANTELVAELLASIKQHHYGPDVAHVEIHGNEVLGVHLVPGLEVSSRSLPDGVAVEIRVQRGVHIKNPVHFCFGLLPNQGVQRILSHTVIEEGASARFIAHCTFPNAVDVQHRMEAEIHIGKGASLGYFERHVHGPRGGVLIVPKTKVYLEEDARYTTEFELIEGAAGTVELDYEGVCKAGATLDMKARLYGRLEDTIHIREAVRLEGEGSTGVLTSHIALKDRAQATIENEIIAEAPFARGHVDCKEIVQGEAQARAIPIVFVKDHRAHVTHEAAIGSVDSKQLETLLSRGLTEDEATDLIIKGLLS